LSNNTAIIKLLLADKRTDINKPNAIGNTALHIALRKGYWPLVPMLLRAGANPDLLDQDGYTALHHAVYQNNLEIVELLISSKAAIDKLSRCDSTALHVACDKEHSSIAIALINANAKLNIANSYGFTALHYAAETNNIPVLRLLLDQGADTTIINSLKSTAFMIARNRKFVKAAQLLSDAQSVREVLTQQTARAKAAAEAAAIKPKSDKALVKEAKEAADKAEAARVEAKKVKTQLKKQAKKVLEMKEAPAFKVEEVSAAQSASSMELKPQPKAQNLCEIRAEIEQACRQNKHDEARALLCNIDDTSMKERASAFIDNNEGHMLFQQRGFLQAQKAFAQAASRNPSKVLYHKNLGTAQLVLENYTEARESLRKAVKLAPRDQDLCTLYSESLVYTAGDDCQYQILAAIASAMAKSSEEENAAEHDVQIRELDLRQEPVGELYFEHMPRVLAQYSSVRTLHFTHEQHKALSAQIHKFSNVDSRIHTIIIDGDEERDAITIICQNSIDDLKAKLKEIFTARNKDLEEDEDYNGQISEDQINLACEVLVGLHDIADHFMQYPDFVGMLVPYTDSRSQNKAGEAQGLILSEKILQLYQNHCRKKINDTISKSDAICETQKALKSLFSKLEPTHYPQLNSKAQLYGLCTFPDKMTLVSTVAGNVKSAIALLQECAKEVTNQQSSISDECCVIAAELCSIPGVLARGHEVLDALSQIAQAVEGNSLYAYYFYNKATEVTCAVAAEASIACEASAASAADITTTKRVRFSEDTVFHDTRSSSDVFKDSIIECHKATYQICISKRLDSVQRHYAFLKDNNVAEDQDPFEEYDQAYFNESADDIAITHTKPMPSSSKVRAQSKKHILKTEVTIIEVSENLHEWQVGTKIVTQNTEGVVKVEARGTTVEYNTYAVITEDCINKLAKYEQQKCFNVLNHLVSRAHGQTGVKRLEDDMHWELKIGDSDTRLIANIVLLSQDHATLIIFD
jgi:tetratricopeptide (TPR) repeat protein